MKDRQEAPNTKINHETQLRAKAWLALTVLSLVALIAHTTQAKRPASIRYSFAEDWTLCMYCISFMIGCFASMLHGVQANGGPKLEHWLTVELFMIMPAITAWIMALPMVISPDNFLAVSVYQITNANLYFATWGAFFEALYITDNILRERFPFTTQTIEASWIRQWLLLLLSSFVSLASYVQLNQSEHCLTYYNFLEPRETDFCRDLQIAVVLSSLSGGMALVLSLVLWCTILMRMPSSSSSLLPCSLGRTFIILLNCFCAMLSSVYWVICLIHLTFDGGPGTLVGTPFFGTWTSFFLSVNMFISHATTTYWLQRRGQGGGGGSSRGGDDDDDKFKHHEEVGPKPDMPESISQVDANSMTEP